MRDKEGGAPTVMVVEGMRDSQNALAQWLRVNGFQVMEESSIETAVEDAVDYTQRERPDIILLELHKLPPDDLAAVCLFRHEVDLRDIPVVVISDRGSEVSHADAAAVGCSEFFIRSENTEQLTNLLINLLHRSQAESCQMLDARKKTY
jgi:chemosensory pili system protein ChpA (sensor histidine kinase/response regulator)